MTVAGGLLAIGAANPAAEATIAAIATGKFDGASSLSAIISVGKTDVEILGEDWSIVSEGSETWTEVSEGTEIWTVVSEGSETWGVQ